MKRLLLAGLLILPFALARAEKDDAYGSLVGMADSAASDKGPEADEIPSGTAPVEERRAAAKPSGEEAGAEFGAARIDKPAEKASAPASASKPAASKTDDDEPLVSVPAASPRVWTRLFASLLPPMTRIAAFEVAASTAPRRAGRAPERPATEASVAGAAQGLLEIVSAATAPMAPEAR